MAELKEFRINGTVIAPGENKQVILNTYELHTQTAIEIPIYVYRSGKPGPTLLLSALLPLFAGCQLLAEQPRDPNIGTTRMQGELSANGGRLLFKPCSEARRFVINDVAGTGILPEAANLAKDANAKLFADVRGRQAGGSVLGVAQQRLGFEAEDEAQAEQDDDGQAFIAPQHR